MKLAVFVPLLLILLVQLEDTDGVCPRTARVFVDCGRGLRGDGFWSRTDAYVKVRVAGSSTMRTRIIHNNNNPIWRRTFFFRRVISPWVTVEVWDKDVRYDDRLGTCRFRMLRGSRNRSYTCRLRRGWVRINYTY